MDSKQPRKNYVLPALCILSWIGSGFGAILSALSLINIKMLSLISEVPGYTSVVHNSEDAGILYIIIKLVLYCAVFFSAILIFRRKRTGFWIYFAMQIILILISFLFFPYPLYQIFSIVIPEIIFSFAFIGLYALHYAEMK